VDVHGTERIKGCTFGDRHTSDNTGPSPGTRYLCSLLPSNMTASAAEYRFLIRCSGMQ
jgi:hypothetical protein